MLSKLFQCDNTTPYSERLYPQSCPTLLRQLVSCRPLGGDAKAHNGLHECPGARKGSLPRHVSWACRWHYNIIHVPGLAGDIRLSCSERWRITPGAAIRKSTSLRRLHAFIEIHQIHHLNPTMIGAGGFGVITVCRPLEKRRLRKELSRSFRSNAHIVEDSAILSAELEKTSSAMVRNVKRV